MNRSEYFNYIEEKLNLLATRINSRGKLNILDFHLHSENFYLYFFNELFGWKLENLNRIQQNVEGIDLIDHANKIIIQVSASNTKQKIESALNKEILKKYPNYMFKFISISREASELRDKTYSNPYSLSFNPLNDIYDKETILKEILSLDVNAQKKFYHFIQKELGSEVDFIKFDSNLATIINILSKEDFSITQLNSEINDFEIDRKIEYNHLDITRMVIEDYSIHHLRLDRKYQEFDKQGSNKSYSVLQSIRSQYIVVSNKFKNEDADNIFLHVIESVKNLIMQSANYVNIPIDELELCVNVLVVDAFIRCKIFKNPEGYKYATT